MIDVNSIETNYKGYRFRSRTEARWAIYFDHIGLEWEYEKEGYDLGAEGGFYLPDFWFPQVRTWAEVKPFELSEEEEVKCLRLAEFTGRPCLILISTPEATSYRSIEPNGDECFYILTSLCLDEKRFYSTWQGDHLSCDNAVLDAVAAAKSARFEHGERGPISKLVH